VENVILKTAVERLSFDSSSRRAKTPALHETPIFRKRKRFPGAPISRLAQSKDFTQKVRKQKKFSAHKMGTKNSFLPLTAVFRVTETAFGR
jgi:hypothetical protein